MSLELISSKWETAKLRDVIEDFQPGFACGKRDENGYVQLRMNNIGLQGKLITDSFIKVPKSETNLKKHKLQKGDVIFNNTNSPELVGKTILFDEEIENCVYSNHLTRIRVDNRLTTPEFIVHYLRHEQRKGTFELLCRRFVGQAAVPRESLLNLDLPLPPLEEQKRIVSKIEELFQETKSARQALDKVPLILKRFRQSVLASAFRGELIPQDPNDESGEKLLARIRQEHHRKWKGEPVDSNALPKLPEGWIWVRMGELIESMKNGLYKRVEFYGKGIPCLRMYNIEDGKIVWKNVKEMILSDEEIREYSLHENDILLNRVNSRELVGKAAVIPSGLGKVVFESKNIRVRTLKGFVEPRYVSYFLQTRFARDQIELECKQTVGMATVSQEDINKWLIPLTSYDEQRRIASKIEELFSFSDQIEKSVEGAKKQADKIDQSILAKAFRGELVPQDPNDEPASALLERIKAGRNNELPKKYSVKLKTRRSH